MVDNLQVPLLCPCSFVYGCGLPYALLIWRFPFLVPIEFLRGCRERRLTTVKFTDKNAPGLSLALDEELQGYTMSVVALDPFFFLRFGRFALGTVLTIA